VSTKGKHRRAPRRRRTLLATAGLTSAAIAGAGFAASPATAATTAAPTPATPVVTLTANHTTVAPNSTVTLRATERTKGGTAIPSERATFQVHLASGWKTVTTRTLSSSGTGTFTYKPPAARSFRVVLPAVTENGQTVYSGVTSKVDTVDVTPIGQRIVATAAREKGKPYRYGAAGPNAFDCSGLVKYVFAKYGITLPHNADAQLHHGQRISRSRIQPGDLVFALSGSHAYHVAIYAGNGYWWEAPHTGASVRHVKMWTSHYAIRRVR
jgi:peptidoglycan DL-endopeptidase CwlO